MIIAVGFMGLATIPISLLKQELVAEKKGHKATLKQLSEARRDAHEAATMLNEARATIAALNGRVEL